MFAHRLTAPVLTILLVASAVGAAATAATADQQRAYAGTHVSFDATNDAIVDYAVDGETVMESVAVQSKSEAESDGDVSTGVDVTAVTDVSGSALSIDSKTETSATATAESGAEISAHDNHRGVLVVRADDGGQYVTVNVSSASRTESDDTVLVTTENGTRGAFVVVGDGEVTVNDDGNVSAALEEDSRLVFRAYADGRDEADRRQEQLIADGEAAAEVYVTRTSAHANETAADVVQYGQDTAVEVTRQSEGTVTMTAERTEHEGKVIIATVSDAVVDSTDNLTVTVDGEAAAKASSYSELRSATDGGETSKFLVRQQSDATATADVLVAVNHFSEREISIAEHDSTDGTENDGETTTTDGSDGQTATGDASDESAGDGTDDESAGTDGSDDHATTEAESDDTDTDGASEVTTSEDESGGPGTDGAGEETTREDEDDGAGTDGADRETTSGNGPGFGVGSLVAAVIALSLYASRRS